jgi:hypothetical protein
MSVVFVFLLDQHGTGTITSRASRLWFDSELFQSIDTTTAITDVLGGCA